MRISLFFRNFASTIAKHTMRKYLLTCLLLLLTVALSAEVITLKTGKVIRGEVLFENDDVVVIRDASGARFQYPKADVASRAAEQTTTDTPDQTNEDTEKKAVSGGKKISLGLEITEGAAILPGKQVGDLIAADLLICSHHIGSKRIMVGGSVGFHGAIFANKKFYSVLPIAAIVRYPVLEGKHSPLIGASLGYGIALNKNITGGIYAGLDVAYRYEINPKSSLYLGLNLQFQQARMKVEQTIEDNTYEGEQGRVFFTPALKFGIAF